MSEPGAGQAASPQAGGLQQATEKDLEKIKLGANQAKRRLKGKDRIGLRVGRIIGKYKMAKYFVITIEEESFSYERDLSSIAQGAAPDSIHVIRTIMVAKVMDANQTVGAYKSLSRVEQAFRSLKTVAFKSAPSSITRLNG